MPEASVRDQIIAQLATLMTVHQIARLQFHEVADVDPKTKYVEGRSSVGTLVLPDEVVQNLENYLNAQPPGRPFLDFRPDIGSYLFPSPKTGMALSTWAMHPGNDFVCALSASDASYRDGHGGSSNTTHPNNVLRGNNNVGECEQQVLVVH